MDLAHGLHGVDSVNLGDRSGVHAYVVMLDCCTFGIICGSLYISATMSVSVTCLAVGALTKPSLDVKHVGWILDRLQFYVICATML